MPNGFLSREEKACRRLVGWIKEQKDERGMNDTELGKEHGISQVAMSRKLREKSFSFKDFVFFVQIFEADDETLHHILGIK